MDAESFKKEFLPYHRKLYAVAYRLLENADDAADVVQDTYLKLWDKREQLAHIENAEAFAVSTTRNLCLDLLRSNRYLQTRESSALDEIEESVMAEDDQERHEQVRQVRDIIAHLPPTQRQVVMLHDVEGCDYGEIERATGFSYSNIRTLLSRARKKIRDEFNKWNHDEAS